jgi:hypothetical protein
LVRAGLPVYAVLEPGRGRRTARRGPAASEAAAGNRDGGVRERTCGRNQTAWAVAEGRNRTAGAAADGRDGGDWERTGGLNRTAGGLHRTGGGGHAQRLNRTRRGRESSRQSLPTLLMASNAVCEWFRQV